MTNKTQINLKLHYFTVFVALLVLMSSCGQIGENDLNQFNLKGKVKTITENYFAAQVNEEGELILKRRIEGESALIDSQEEESPLSYVTTMHFNKKGFRTKLLVKDSSATDFSFMEIFTYNKGELLQKRERYDQKGLLFLDTFEYNKHMEVKHQSFDRDRYLLESTETSYADNKVVAIVKGLSDEDNEKEIDLLFIKTSILNGRGKPTSIVRQGDDELLFDKRVLTYDESGRLLEEVSYDNQNIPYQKSVTTYDTYGNETNFEMINLSNSTEIVKYSYQYKYDDQGNWVEQVTLINEEIDNITTREIEYYD